MVQIPGFTITPPTDVTPGVSTALSGGDIAGAGGASAALGGSDIAAGSVEAGPLGLLSLVNLFDPSFFGGDPGASPAQIAANVQAMGGMPAIIAAAQAQGLPIRAGAAEFSPAAAAAPTAAAPTAATPTAPTAAAPLSVPTAAALTTPSSALAFTEPGAGASDILPPTSELTVGPSPLDTMGGGGDLSPEDAAARGAPVQGVRSIDDPSLQPGPSPGLEPVSPITTGGRALYSGGEFQGIEGVAPAASPGGAGLFGTGISAGDALRYGGPLLALGSLGATIARGQPSLPPAAQQQLQVTGPGSPIFQVSQNYATEAATGNLQPGETAQIQKYQQDAENQLYQQLANEGITDPRSDSRFIQGKATIAQNSQIMYQQFITAAVTNAINALGPTTSALTNAAQLQMENDQNYRASLAAATQAFGVTAALSTFGSRTA